MFGWNSSSVDDKELRALFDEIDEDGGGAQPFCICLCFVFPLPSWLGRSPTIFVAKTGPLPCDSTVFVAKTVLFVAVGQARWTVRS